MKRTQLISQLRKLARKNGVEFTALTERGKGSHIRITFGTRATTLKDGELNPGYVRLIKKQLGITD